MTIKQHVVRLSAGERTKLTAVVRTRKPVSPEKRRRAQILLKVDEGKHGPKWTDAEVAEAFDTHPGTVSAVRKRFATAGLDRALERKEQERPSTPRKLDGAAEARLIATVQGPPPEGKAKWSLRLLSDRIVVLGISSTPASYEAIRRALKKTNSSPT